MIFLQSVAKYPDIFRPWTSVKFPEFRLKKTSISSPDPILYFQTVGKNIIRTSTFIKVGVEDFIIGNVSKKVDEKRYHVEDMANTVEWGAGLNYDSNVQITATSSKVNLETLFNPHW